MAERRMFAKTIIDSDAFLDMPVTAQLLYFHLSMRADDDGFINKPKSIMRICGCRDDDMHILISKKFVIPFDSGIVVIKHWKIHNYIRKDSYSETKYKNEKSTLQLDENNAYTTANSQLCDDTVTEPSQECDDTVTGLSTQDRIGKDRIGKDNSTMTNVIVRCSPAEQQRIIDAWNTTGLASVSKIGNGTTRQRQLQARIKEYSVDDVLAAIEKVKQSDFLRGGGKNGWQATFDWLIKPNNFPKVLEGNFDNRSNSKTGENRLNWIRDWAQGD